MSRYSTGMKTCSIIAIVAYLFLFAPCSPALAAWVTTSDALGSSRAKLLTLVEREDVKASIASYGVDPAEAARRVEMMSEEEAAHALAKIDATPAGGDGIGVVIGAALVVFVVFIITDILGYTNVFSFVKKAK